MKPKAFLRLARRVRKLGAIQVTTPDGFTVTWGEGAEGGRTEPAAARPPEPVVGFVIETYSEGEDDVVPES